MPEETHTTRWRRALAVTAFTMCMLAAAHAWAQGVDVTAGSSSLLGVHGLTLAHYMGDRSTVFSVGANHGGVVFGGATEFHRPDGITRYGDTVLGFALPTDIDAAGRSVGARGVDWTVGSSAGGVHIFAGKTGDPFGVGYLSTVAPQRWASSVEWTHHFSPHVRLQALTAVGAAHAALLSGEYIFGAKAEVAATAGWNAGHPVAVVSTKMNGDSWTLRASVTMGRLELRPETAALNAFDEEHVPERGGLNFAVEKRLAPWLTSDAQRVQFAKDDALGLPDGAVLHEAGVTAHSGSWGAGARAYQSHDALAGTTSGLAGLIAYTYGTWRVEAQALRSWRPDNSSPSALVVDASKEIASVVRVTGGADFSSTGPSVVAGVSVHGAWGEVGVDQRTVYIPFGAGAGFKEVTMIHLLFHPKGVETSVSTVAGKGMPWMYTATANKFIQMASPVEGPHMPYVQPPTVPRFVVRGRVVDQDGKPLAAAAVRVNDHTTVWTDGDGYWQTRQRQHGAVRVALDPDQFMTTKRYQALSPETTFAYAVMDNEDVPITMVARACVGPCEMNTITDVLVPTAERRLPGAPIHYQREPHRPLPFARALAPFKRVFRAVARGDLR